MSAPAERLLKHLRTLVPETAECTDEELLACFLQGNADAFARLVDHHGPMVLGACRRILSDLGAAEDVAQATFLVLARKAGSIRRPESLAAWLHQTACRLARNHRQAEARRRERETRGLLAAPARPSADPLEEVTVRELLLLFDEELQRLPEPYRAPLILCCLEGRTQEEAARQLGWTRGVVKGRLDRARSLLHDGLVRRGVGLPAALVALEAVRGTASAGLADFLEQTTRIALQVATGPTAAGLAREVEGIAEAALGSTTTFHSKLVLSLLLTVGLTAGVAVLAQQGPAEKPATGRQTSTTQPAAKPRRTDRQGDPLPEGALARLGTVRWRTGGVVSALAIAPDGKTTATASTEGVCLFDGDGKLLRRIRPADTTYERVSFSPDGKRFACCSNVPMGKGRTARAVQVWETVTGKKLRQFKAEGLQWLGWTPKGEPVGVFLVKDALLVRELAAGKERRLQCKDLPRPDPDSGYYACCYVPAAGLLAFPDQHTAMHVWEVATGKERLTTKAAWVQGIDISRDGRWLVWVDRPADGSDTVQLWDLKTGKMLRTFTPEQKYVRSVVFAPDGKTLALSGWTDLRFHDVSSGRESGRSQAADTFGSSMFSPDGRTLVTVERYSGTIHRWEVPSGRMKPEPIALTGRPVHVAFSPNGSRVATNALDRTIIIWDVKTAKPLVRLLDRDAVRSSAFSRDGRLLLYSTTGDSLVFADASTGRMLHRVKVTDPDRPESRSADLTLHLSDDGKTAVSLCTVQCTDAGQREWRLLIAGWDPATRKQIFHRSRRNPSLWPIVSPNGKLLAVTDGDAKEDIIGASRQVRVEDLASGKHILTLPRAGRQSWPSAFSPDGRLLAVVSRDFEAPSYELRLWELASGKAVASIPSSAKPRTTFSRDGRLVALAGPNGAIVVHDLKHGKQQQRIVGLDAGVTALAFSPDARLLVSGLANSELLVWEVAGRPREKPASLDDATLVRLWNDLGSDAGKAFVARGVLADSPAEAVKLLKKHLKPVQTGDASVSSRLLADLDSDTFSTREKARKELERLGDRARGALEATLKTKPALETHRRIERLLERLDLPVADSETIRGLRAIAILEDIRSAESKKLLMALARGMVEARWTREAKAALERLAR